MSWTHRKVFESLVARNQLDGTRGTTGMNRPGTLTWLYPQAMDCAVLYSPDREQKRPLHLNPGRPDWNADVYKNVLPAIKSINLEQRKKGDRNRSFLHCEIRDENNGDTEAGWKIIAQPLGL